MSPSVREAQQAPPFQGVDQTGRQWDGAELRGQWVLLYFYPKDETYGCIREACGFRDAHPQLRTEGVVVLGASGDSVESHKRFADHYELPFPLLTADKRFLKAFGARGLFGVVRRLSFLIDPQGRIAKTYRVRNWSEHASEVVQDVKALKTAQKALIQTKSEPPKQAI